MSSLLKGIPEVGSLTPEQEGRLAGGDEAALETLVLANLREGVYYAKGSASGCGFSDGELLSAVYDALSAAAQNFQPNRIRFFSYAKPYVRGAISRLRKSNDLVKRVRTVEPLPVEPTDDEPEDGDISVRPTKPAELPPCELPDFEGLFAREEFARLAPLLRSALDEKSRVVLELNYQGGLNLREIADLLGVTRSDVQHVRHAALKKLRLRLADREGFLDR